MQINNSDSVARLLSFLATGIYSAAEIQQRFGYSQPTVSRLITKNGDKIIAIGNARSRRYTALRDVRGLGGEFPIYKIDSDGNAHLLGNLFAVAHDGFSGDRLVAANNYSEAFPGFSSICTRKDLSAEPLFANYIKNSCSPPGVSTGMKITF